MRVVSCQQVNLLTYGYGAHPCVWQLHVEIDHADFPGEGLAMINYIRDKSWLDKFDIINKDSFDARITPTINLLVQQIANESVASTMNSIKSDFAELLVSVNAQKALVQIGHQLVPLSELWKEKIRSNAGFDFHTISPNALFVYGEAKYAADNTSNSRAVRQIAEFLQEKKHKMDIALLRIITQNEEAAAKAVNEQIGIAAAFSVNQASVQSMINNAIYHHRFRDLLNRPEIYIIAVEII